MVPSEPSRPDAPPIDPFQGVVLAGGYRVEKLIARGGMGEVYIARHIELKQTAAVKFLHRRFAADDDLAQRFAAEASTSMRVKHPLAVHVHNYGRLPDGTLYIVMEWVDGISLAHLLEKRGSLDVATAVRIGLLAAEVLSVAHRQSVIHRDVKPDNIMVIEGPQGRPSIKMLDFGIAKILGDDTAARTQTGTVYGTPEYMSPEQAEGKPVDHRGDIYQLGLVMYAMVVGHPPFEAQNKLSILQRHIKERHVPVAKASKSKLPEDFAALIDRMLAKDPKERPQSFDEVLDALEKLAPGVGPSRTPLRTLDTAVASESATPAAVPAPRAAAPERTVEPPRILRRERSGEPAAVGTGDFSLGPSKIPVQAELRFELPASGGGSEENWSLSGGARSDFERPFDDGEPGGDEPPQRRVGFFAVIFAVAAIVALVAAASVLRERAYDRSRGPDENAGSGAVVEASGGSGEGSQPATSLAEGSAAPHAVRPPAATPDAGAARPPASASTSPTVAVPTTVPAAVPTAAPVAPVDAITPRVREAIADLREGRVDRARATAAELAALPGASDNAALTSFRADLAALDELETNIATLLAANLCVRADEQVVAMRTRFSQRLASRHYAALDACRQAGGAGGSADAGTTPSGGGGTSGGSSTGGSTSGGSSRDDDGRVTPPREL
jgi:serine/threonine-protein kinase